MSGDLTQLRTQIDEIDGQLVELFRKRMEISRDVSAYKKANGLPTMDAGRERALLAKVAEQAGEPLAGYTQSVFRTMMAAGRSYQDLCSGVTSQVYENIEAAMAETKDLFPRRATVACQGVEGAYSQIACDQVFQTPSILYFDTFEHVFRAVESGMCQYGILPIENSTAGSVNAIYDLMTRHDFSIVRSIRLKVSHDLLVRPGVRREDIREIFSHEQAIRQCADYLTGFPNAKITYVENTAVAARMVAQSGRTDAAALSSRPCGQVYGLEVLEQNVQDQDNNYTRFICISKHIEIYPGADRTSLMMTLPHRPGALYQVLSAFYALGINLRKLESRPIPNREFEFVFYFDLECSVYAPEMKALFRDLEGSCEQLRYLGTYSEIVF